MKKRVSPNSHTVSGVFVFLLIGLFAITSILLVLMGVRVYRSVTDAALGNTDYQLALSYLCNKVHAYDHEGGVAIGQEDGMQVLYLKESIDGDAYETRIYCYDNTIYEYFAAVGDAFDPEYGEALTQVDSMAFSAITPNLLQVDVTLPNGDQHVKHMALRSNQVR